MENEEICKRDNAKAKDITKGRNLTANFYDKLEKENKVDILKPETTLIKSAIDEKLEQNKSKAAEVGASAGVVNSNTAVKKPAQPTKKPANNVKKAPVKKMTVAEIEKELGYKVEIVSEVTE